VGIHTIHFFELLRVTARVNLRAKRAIRETEGLPAPSAAISKTFHRINVLTPISYPYVT
jgi:hypothetical protein